MSAVNTFLCSYKCHLISKFTHSFINAQPISHWTRNQCGREAWCRPHAIFAHYGSARRSFPLTTTTHSFSPNTAVTIQTSSCQFDACDTVTACLWPVFRKGTGRKSLFSWTHLGEARSRITSTSSRIKNWHSPVDNRTTHFHCKLARSYLFWMVLLYWINYICTYCLTVTRRNTRALWIYHKNAGRKVSGNKTGYFRKNKIGTLKRKPKCKDARTKKGQKEL